MKKGDVIKPGNFRLVKQINKLDELYFVLRTQPSLFVRHRIYPSAFVMGWPIRQCQSWIDSGRFWKVQRINKLN